MCGLFSANTALSAAIDRKKVQKCISDYYQTDDEHAKTDEALL
jgi:hypothetical protein